MTLKRYSAVFAPARIRSIPQPSRRSATAQRGPQPDPTKALPPSVYSNPRSGPDDPRIGLKPGLLRRRRGYLRTAENRQHAEAAGIRARSQRPGTPSASPSTCRRACRWPRRGGPTINTGSVNSDLAFIGNHLFVGNY